MESKNEIKEKFEFEIKYFKISYIVIWTLIIALNAVILPLLIMVYFDFIPLFRSSVRIIRVIYIIIIISPIIKIGFEACEIVRLGLFLKLDEKDKESANNTARGFIGTRIFRNYYLVIIIILFVIGEIVELIAKNGDLPGNDADFLAFYLLFSILISIDIFLIAAGPHLIKYSIDYIDKTKKMKAIVWSIVWIVVLLIILNLDYLIPYFD